MSRRGEHDRVRAGRRLGHVRQVYRLATVDVRARIIDTRPHEQLRHGGERGCSRVGMLVDHELREWIEVREQLVRVCAAAAARDLCEVLAIQLDGAQQHSGLVVLDVQLTVRLCEREQRLRPSVHPICLLERRDRGGIVAAVVGGLAGAMKIVGGLRGLGVRETRGARDGDDATQPMAVPSGRRVRPTTAPPRYPRRRRDRRRRRHRDRRYTPPRARRGSFRAGSSSRGATGRDCTSRTSTRGRAPLRALRPSRHLRTPRRTRASSTARSMLARRGGRTRVTHRSPRW